MEPWCWTVRNNSQTPQFIMSKSMNRQATEFWWWSDQAVVMIGLSQISHTNKQKRKWSTFVRPLLTHDSSSVGFVGSLFNFSSVQPGSWSSFTFMCLTHRISPSLLESNWFLVPLKPIFIIYHILLSYRVYFFIIIYLDSTVAVYQIDVVIAS